MKKHLIAAVAVTLGLATASASPRDRTSVPEATPDGKPISCVQTSSISSTQVHGKVYRNTLPNSCPGLGFEERFLYTTSIGELCSVDTITVLQSPGLSRGATCGLGTFQPVQLVKAAAR
jgi:hypothetical protein